MSIISISELKKHCYSIMAEVEKSQQPVLISKKGKTIAKIIPSPQNHNNESFLGCMTSSGKIKGDITAPGQDENEWEVLRK